MTNKSNTPPSSPTACILLIGNEILSGRTQDSNLVFLARSLRPRGIRVAESRIIQDDESIIISTLNEVRAKHDLIFTTGGIGPTHDDITAASIAKALDTPLERNKKALELLTRYYESHGHQMNEIRARMANIPKGAELLVNPASGAPGFRIENIYVLPGVPRIMQAIFHEFKDTLPLAAPIIMRTVTLCCQESSIADSIALIQKNHPDVEIGSYPFLRNEIPHVSLVAKSTHLPHIEETITEMVSMAREHKITPELSDN